MKLNTRVFLQKEKTPLNVNDCKPIIIKFRGKVPLSLTLFDGLLIMFVILLSNLSGLFAAFGVKSYKWIIFLTVFSLVFLGFFVHPLVQKYSLDVLWSKDWNINSKVLLTLIIWSIALIFSIRKNYRIWPVIASGISFVIFLIPHQIPAGEPAKMTLDVLQRNFIALLQLF